LETKIGSCKEEVKNAMKWTGVKANSGGRRRLVDNNGRVLAAGSVDIDTETALEDAAMSAVSNAVNKCMKDADDDTQKDECKTSGDKIYKKSGGDADKS
jgi:hypothetical protein